MQVPDAEPGCALPACQCSCCSSAMQRACRHQMTQQLHSWQPHAGVQCPNVRRQAGNSLYPETLSYASWPLSSVSSGKQQCGSVALPVQLCTGSATLSGPACWLCDVQLSLQHDSSKHVSEWLTSTAMTGLWSTNAGRHAGVKPQRAKTEGSCSRASNTCIHSRTKLRSLCVQTLNCRTSAETLSQIPWGLCLGTS